MAINVSGFTRWLGDQWNNLTGTTAKMEWEKNMSDTAHQREVADLKAAGLNPVLSSGGSGASVVASPSSAGDPLSSVAGPILGLVNSATKLMNASALLTAAHTGKQSLKSRYKTTKIGF